MKKLTLVLIGIILSATSFSQSPFDVKEDIYIENGDSTSVCLDITKVYIKTKVNGDLVLRFENPRLGIYQREVVKVLSYEKLGEGIGSLRIYKCYNKQLGNIIVEEELETMTGKIILDEDDDGVFDRVFVLN